VENVLTNNYDQLASLCHCTKRTIIRTVGKMRSEGKYEEALWTEFSQLYPKIKADYPDKAFDRLCYLLGRTMVRKLEAHTVEEIKQTHVFVSAKLIKDESTTATTDSDVAVRAASQAS
jgi:hypothetical protein